MAAFVVHWKASPINNWCSNTMLQLTGTESTEEAVRHSHLVMVCHPESSRSSKENPGHLCPQLRGAIFFLQHWGEKPLSWANVSHFLQIKHSSSLLLHLQIYAQKINTKMCLEPFWVNNLELEDNALGLFFWHMKSRKANCLVCLAFPKPSLLIS